MKNNKVLGTDLLLFFLLLIAFVAVEGFTTAGEYFYSSLGWVDHWLYLGHFEYGPLFEPTHIWNYKSSRLPWIWQGHLIFKYLNYPYNNYFIVLFSLTKFWIAFWLCAREFLFSKKQILFYICIFMFYPTLRSNGGWFYHNLEACSWWLLAIYTLRLVETKRLPDKFIILAGFFAGLSLNTNIFFLNFLPIFILMAPRLFYSKKSLAIMASSGIILSIGFFGLINFLQGGPFQYYLPMYYFITKFQGASELWKPFLYCESFNLFILLSSIASYSLYANLVEYIKTRIYHHRPFTVAYLYTAIMYLFWHFKGVEVLSINIHNSMLLLMGFLMLVEVGESIVAKKSINTYMLILIFLLTWTSVHFFSPILILIPNFSFVPYSFALISLAPMIVLVAVLGIALRTKNVTLWIGAFTIIPYLMSPYRVYPKFGVTGDKCFNGRRNHDIVFDIKEEIQKISSPIVLSLQGEFEIAKAIDYIGMHNKWPLKSYFDENCHFLIAGTKVPLKSIDHRYLAIISSSKFTGGEILQCKTWPKYDRTVIHKEYKQCNGDSVIFSIFSAKN